MDSRYQLICAKLNAWSCQVDFMKNIQDTIQDIMQKLKRKGLPRASW